jgi:hypothetical protein
MNKGASQHEISPANMVLVAIATGLATFFAFPAIIYTSIVLYGLPAALFILTGYIVWLLLVRRDRKMGNAFALGFFPVIAFCLLGPLSAKPFYVLVVILPVVCLWIVHRLMRLRLQ